MASGVGATCCSANVTPCRSHDIGLQPAEDVGGNDAWDPDRLVKCPYDPNHMIRQSRFPYHVLKCKKNHPESSFKTCGYNARHIVLQEDLAKHMATCLDQQSVENEVTGNAEMLKKYIVPVNTMTLATKEDWDKEEETDAKPFVWGVNSQVPIAPRLEVTDNLVPGVRKPHILPWK